MKLSRVPVVALLTIVAWLGLPASSAEAVTTLSGITNFSANSSGSSIGDAWNTQGADAPWNVYLVAGTDPTGVDPIINPGNAAPPAPPSISIPLSSGTYTYTFYVQRSSGVSFDGVNLFFNGDGNTPRISARAPTWDNGGDPIPVFSANPATSSTLDLDTDPVPASGSLTFVDGTITVSLTEFFFADTDVFNRDRVRDQNSTPNGSLDYVGRLTLSVSDSTPEPGTLALFGAGLAGLAGSLRRRRMRAAGNDRDAEDEGSRLPGG